MSFIGYIEYPDLTTEEAWEEAIKAAEEKRTPTEKYYDVDSEQVAELKKYYELWKAEKQEEEIREVERAQRKDRFANMSEELEDLFARFCAYNNGELDDAAKKQLLEDAAIFDGGCEAAIAHYSQKYDYDISQAGGSMELMKIMQHMDSIAKHYTKLKEEL